MSVQGVRLACGEVFPFYFQSHGTKAYSFSAVDVIELGAAPLKGK